MIKDLYSGRIVDWAMDKRMTQQIVINALNQTVGRQHSQRGVILHSDRGVQYSAKKYRNVLTSYGFRQSMIRKGDCWDNAPMESFSVRLRPNLFTTKITRPALRHGRTSLAMWSRFIIVSGCKNALVIYPPKITKIRAL